MLFRKLTGIFLSFFSKAFYREVGQVWKGMGMSYLLLITLILSLPFMQVSYFMALKLTNNLQTLTAQFPVVTIQEGQVSINQPSPQLVIDPVTQKSIGIFDTNSTEEVTHDKNILFVINKNKVIINLPNMTTPKVYDLTNAKNFIYDKTAMTMIMNKIKIALVILFCMTAFLFYFIPSTFVVFFYAAVMKGIARIHLPYKMLCRLTAVALTPTLFLAAILHLLDKTLPYQIIVYVLLSLGYLFFAIEVNKQIGKQAEI